MNTLAYEGRLVDVAAFDLNVTTGAMTPSLSGASGSGTVTAGWYALANRFAVELFTESESIPFLPQRGCGFMIDARRGDWRTNLDVRQSFYSARIDIARSLRGEEDDTDPDDERYLDSRLVFLEVQPTSVRLTVDLVSRAGEQHTFIAPISVVPGGFHP